MSSPSSTSERPTVVLAHPHLEMRGLLREQLAERYRALAAGRPHEAWVQVRKEEPDLLVADEGLPEPGGRALCQKVKEAPNVGSVSVLLLTDGDAGSSDEAPPEENQARKGSPPETPSASDLPKVASSEPAEQFSADPSSSEQGPTVGPDRRLEKPFSADALLRAVQRLLGTAGAVETVLHLIDRRLGDPGLTAGDLAEAVDLSRRHLTRRLKEKTGQTPAALLRERRIEAAKRHLRAGPDSIKEVAEAAGFRSASHFSQVFREAVGQTPSAYRERHDSQ